MDLIGEDFVTTIRCANAEFTNLSAVIFDKDGTLEDSHCFLRELAQRRSRLIDAQIPGIGDPLLMSFGILDATLDPTGLTAVGSRQENEIAAAAYIAETGRSWHESLEIARNAFDEADRYLPRTAETVPLFPGTQEMLQALKTAGLKLGILSADSTAGVKAFVERHQLSNYFQLEMGVDRGGKLKPDPHLFVEACETLSVKPSATLMVGDSALDIEMAQRAGAAGAVGVNHSGTKALTKADATIATWDRLAVIS